jgi:glycerol kinase
VSGIHRGTRREHLVRAALEAIAFQVCDVVEAADVELGVLRADGGGADNGFLLQLQADLAGIPVEVPAEREATALGAAALAGLAVGVWSSAEEIGEARRIAARYEPELARAEADRLVGAWRAAVRRALLPD